LLRVQIRDRLNDRHDFFFGGKGFLVSVALFFEVALAFFLSLPCAWLPFAMITASFF
jgi:hypothetical protein